MRQETPIFGVHLQTPPQFSLGLRRASETERSTLQGLASPWNTIPVNAQDATKQRGVETNRQEAAGV